MRAPLGRSTPSGTATGESGTATAESGEGGPAERRFTPDFVTEMFRNPLDPGYAEAARRRAERGGTPPRRALGGRAARTVVLVLAGFLLAIAYHQTVATTPESTRIRANLIDDVRSRQAETDVMQHQADELRDQVSRLRDAALSGSDTDALRALEARVGVIKVRGGGAVVRLTDAPTQVDPVTGQATKNLGKVLDRDLQAVCNELWHDGAEAIAVNGERLTAASTIRAAGSTILVDFRPITSPYEVTAIGPGDLQKRFTNSPTGQLFRDLATDYHMQVSVKAQGNLTLAAAADPALHYAQPVPTASPAHPSGSPAPTSSASKGR